MTTVVGRRTAEPRRSHTEVVVSREFANISVRFLLYHRYINIHTCYPSFVHGSMYFHEVSLYVHRCKRLRNRYINNLFSPPLLPVWWFHSVPVHQIRHWGVGCVDAHQIYLACCSLDARLCTFTKFKPLYHMKFVILGGWGYAPCILIILHLICMWTVWDYTSF